MKIIIAGPRDLFSKDGAFSAIEEGISYITSNGDIEVEEIVSGCAYGVDRYAEEWARSKKIKVTRFPVHHRDYKRLGLFAPRQRNFNMARYVGIRGGLLALTYAPPGAKLSIGTAHMVETALDIGMVTKVIYNVGEKKDNGYV